ncbi:type II CAAX endopeptidase family protein [Herbivorax sp. ANBcel31]|uniref:CPBP family intramembrane glutamic endopeptidase n=1 Tax=Herbivorax sp. ANBcel31 TaxID=3069754 RepID=UPI0027B41C6D|nr:type II CAAX endopeptidase family protein [Herbivorax sp. ANBcel31]MDQ2086926.1 type II CAAX endopeptidase family protein [Herbivorax sp. ANBcel31]
MKNKLKMILHVFIHLLVFVGVQSLIVVVTGLIYGVIESIRFLDEGNATLDTFQIENQIQGFIFEKMPIILIASFFISVAIYLIIFKIRKINILEAGGFSKMKFINIPSLLIFSVAINIFLSFVIVAIEGFMSSDEIFLKHEELMNIIMGSSNIFLLLISVGILFPVLEEVVFRGFIFSELKKNMNVIWAVIIQALLFGLVHLNIVQGTYAFFLGIILACVYIWTKSIWAPIIVHIVFNSYSVLANEYPQIGEYNVFTLVASTILVVLTILLIYKNREIPERSELA